MHCVEASSVEDQSVDYATKIAFPAHTTHVPLYLQSSPCLGGAVGFSGAGGLVGVAAGDDA